MQFARKGFDFAPVHQNAAFPDLVLGEPARVELIGHSLDAAMQDDCGLLARDEVGVDRLVDLKSVHGLRLSVVRLVIWLVCTIVLTSCFLNHVSARQTALCRPRIVAPRALNWTLCHSVVRLVPGRTKALVRYSGVLPGYVRGPFAYLLYSVLRAQVWLLDLRVPPSAPSITSDLRRGHP